MDYIKKSETGWPRTPRRRAAALRRRLDLPGVNVVTQGDLISIRWTDGPPVAPVMAQLRPELPKSGWRVSRVFEPATFAAAMLLPEQRPLVGWERARGAFAMLHARDLISDPLPTELVLQGQTLAKITGVNPGALIGWHRVRWDWHMHKKLEQIGDDVLAAIVAEPDGPIGGRSMRRAHVD